MRNGGNFVLASKYLQMFIIHGMWEGLLKCYYYDAMVGWYNRCIQQLGENILNGSKSISIYRGSLM